MSFLNETKNQIIRDVSEAVDVPDIFKANRNTYAGSRGLPWSGDGLDSIERAFFSPYEIKGERWNKMFPYRLVVYDIVKKQIVKGPNSSGTITNTLNFTEFGYLIDQELVTGNWEVRLPITPQQLQISDQYAINTSATMRGVVEEHNGVRFKMIAMSGTTGIWPTRPTEGGKVQGKSSFSTIFSGTLEQLGNVASSVRSVASAFNGEHPNPAINVIGPEGGDLFSTGYYQALYMAQFIERYAEAKRRPENKNWRLVLDIPKQNQSFVVTPQACALKQNAQKPNQIMYALQFKAWKRISLDTSFEELANNAIKLDVNDFQRLVDTIRETRRTLSSAVNLIKAVRSDFQRPFDILRQASLAVKDAGGVVFATADLPRNIIADFKSTIEDSLENLSSAFERPNARFKDTAGVGSFTPSAVSIKSESPEQRAGAAFTAISANKAQSEGLSGAEINNGALGQNAIDSAKIDPTNVIFDNPEENFVLFDNVPLNALDLTPEQEDAVSDELAKIDTMTVDTFRTFKSEMLSLSNDISNSYGTLDDTYANVYGLQTPKTRDIDLTIEENEVMLAIFDFIQVLDELTATKAFDDLSIQNPLEYVGGLASNTEINFESFSSKKPVPVPFGLSIEEIAARYMGNPDKWLEIATLNNMRSPYIDEEGYTLPLLSNASGRQFTVEDLEDRLYIGQKIILVSDTVQQLSTKIINLEEILEGQFLISVDGDVDLSIYTTSANARMIGYLPGTVNSQNQIFIPTNEAAQEDDRTFTIPGLKDLDGLTNLSKVDWLLTDDGDVAINSVGEIRYSNGLNNLIQALKLKIQTKKGSLLRHLDYGLGIQHGVSVADIENGEIVKSFNKMIESDPRFEGIDRIQIELIGPTLKISLSVRVAGNSGVLPISFNVPAR